MEYSNTDRIEKLTWNRIRNRYFNFTVINFEMVTISVTNDQGIRIEWRLLTFCVLASLAKWNYVSWVSQVNLSDLLFGDS